MRLSDLDKGGVVVHEYQGAPTRQREYGWFSLKDMAQGTECSATTGDKGWRVIGNDGHDAHTYPLCRVQRRGLVR